MNDRPEWFSPKRFGYGSAMPCSWQGWLVTLAYAAVMLGSAYFFARRPVILISIMSPATALFLVTAWRTTKGGWHWRWGRWGPKA